MLGFPPPNYDPLAGVFDNIVQLSHEIPHSAPPPDYWRDLTLSREPRPWLFFGNAFDDDIVIKPRIQRGQEILVYHDRHTFHATPDVTPFHCSSGRWRLV